MTVSDTVAIRAMRAEDFAGAVRLWEASPGVRQSLGDTPEGIAMYLDRNPGLSLVAEAGGAIVGVVLCGHDGRRGYIHHVAVAGSHRRAGLGRTMIERCLAALVARGIPKCHLFVVPGNDGGKAFWSSLGWHIRTDIEVMSVETAT